MRAKLSLLSIVAGICANAAIPSCMRAPPLAAKTITGTRSSVARSNARQMASKLRCWGDSLHVRIA